jgi:hypothetical protein
LIERFLDRYPAVFRRPDAPVTPRAAKNAQHAVARTSTPRLGRRRSKLASR